MTVRDVFTFAWLLEEAGDGPLARGVAYSLDCMVLQLHASCGCGHRREALLDGGWPAPPGANSACR